MERKGPFGLWMGMNASDFSEPLKEIAPFKFQVAKVSKPHSAFDMYAAQVTPRTGLSWVKAVGKTIQTSSYGIELKTAFDAMEKKLSTAYGQCKRHDFLLHESIWSEPRDWMQGLINKERVLMSEWNGKTGAVLKDSLSSIALVITAYNTASGCVSIEYSFDNMDAAEEEIASLEDGAL